MNYEAKSYQTKEMVNNGDGTATFTISVISGIVGDTYGFIRGDATTVKLALSKTGTVIYSDIEAAVDAFVASKYPNT